MNDKYQKIAKEMCDDDKDKDKLCAAVDDMFGCRWTLKPPLNSVQWVHKVVSTDPHDALRAGTRVLSSLRPLIKYYPLGEHMEDARLANDIERALGWHFKNANKRKRASVLRDIVFSALAYDEVVAQVTHLGEHNRAYEAITGKRQKYAERGGPFAVTVHNPRNVSVRYSDFMPEAVLLKKVLPIHECLAFWGDAANELKKKSKNATNEFVTLYDYIDLDRRVVWAIRQGTNGDRISEPINNDAIEFVNDENKLGFIPWVAKVGGSNLFSAGDMQRIPLLWSIVASGQWDTQNSVETIMASEVIAYAAAPRLKVEGPTDEVEVNYGEPGRPAYVPPGHELSEMRPPEMDTNLTVLADRIQQRIGKSTIPKVLQTGDFPSGTAFATLNLATQSGTKALNPYKELGEHAVADVLTLFLYWINYTGEEIWAYVKNDKGMGEQIPIGKKDFDVNNIYLEVELTPDVPTDRMQRINAGMGMIQMGYSPATVMDTLGTEDPLGEINKSRENTREQVAFDNEMKIRSAEADIFIMMETERAKAALAKELNPQAAQATPEQNQQQMLLDKWKQLQNPNQGGMPPAMGAPEATREMQTGQDFFGLEMEE